MNAETLALLLGLAGAAGFVVGVIVCAIGEALFRKFGGRRGEGSAG